LASAVVSGGRLIGQAYSRQVILLTSAAIETVPAAEATSTAEAMFAMESVPAVKDRNEYADLRPHKIWVRTIVGVIIAAVIHWNGNTAGQHE
jgi:hypothetical protein